MNYKSQKMAGVLITCMLLILSAGILNAATEDPLLSILEEELEYNFEKLRYADSVELYYMAYQVTENHNVNLSAELGALTTDADNLGRHLDVTVRVGSYELDNTREVAGSNPFNFRRGSVPLPLDENEEAIKMKLWEETDRRYKEAQKMYTNVLTNIAVKVEAEDQSDDFSREEVEAYIGDEVSFEYDEDLWKEKVKKYSSVFNNYPEIENSSVSLSASRSNKYFVSSEGAKIQDGLKYIRLSISCNTTADDGMNLRRFHSFDAADFANMPNDEEVYDVINTLIDEIIGLKSAPLAEPYTGPAILTGRAAGVFFHEIFGHRMEGHRQKSEKEGQTFTNKVGELVLPEIISVYSDPTIQQYNDTDLRGFYRYDDQGIEGKRVALVDHGILRNFMMSRSPIENFPNSNGHGRRSHGNQVVSRQSNLIIESDKSVSFDELKQELIAECKRQDKPYGLIFDDISGGFTSTRRAGVQTFKVIPLVVYKVYVDDGHTELIRGVDIVGTPLTSFSKIILAGDDPDIFNGTCGAESGWVPVSAISPSLLLSEIEIERSQKGQDRPPLLASPVSKQP